MPPGCLRCFQESCVAAGKNSGLELMGLLVRFHRSEIVGKPKITDGTQHLLGSGFIGDGKPMVFQQVDLLFYGEGVFGILHTCIK